MRAKLETLAGRHASSISDLQSPSGLQFVLVAALISTLVIVSTSLPASHKLPSGPTTMWRTTPPPDGRIGHVWNFSVAGSNRTSMFGFAFPSTYQTILPEAVMA